MTVTIYQFGAGGYWTGASEQIAEDEGCPQGWTREPLPELGEGKFAVFEAPAWMVTSDPFEPEQAAEPVPAWVYPTDAKLALLRHDPPLFEFAEAAVQAAGPEAMIFWTSAQRFDRYDPWVLAIGDALGLDAEAIDALFRTARPRT